MHRPACRFAACLPLALGGTVHAQVYRCGDSGVYTDKPCEGATPVDLRANVLDAGPRRGPADPAPAPAVIPKTPAVQPRSSESTGSVWSRQASRESGHRSRTAPVHRP